MVDRFWKKVRKQNDGCWVWTASKTKTGYGRFGVGRGVVGSHRYSWQIHNGEIPDGLSVLHHCDNRACVNPDHLWLGTQRDNLDDMRKKGRANAARGEAAGLSKLTKNQVLEIRRRAALGEKHSVLAAEFCVSESRISCLKTRRDWSWLT